MTPKSVGPRSGRASALRFLLRHPRSAVAMLAYLPFALIQWATPWRFLRVTNPTRIGHLAADVDWFLKKQTLGDFPGVRPVLLLPTEGGAANGALVAIWARYVTVIGNPAICALLCPLSYFRMLTIDTAPATTEDPADYPKLAGVSGGSPPVSLSR